MLLSFPTPPAPHSPDFPPFADLHGQTVPAEGLGLEGAFQEHLSKISIYRVFSEAENVVSLKVILEANCSA